MGNLKFGSHGSNVKKLQEALIKPGYNVGNSGAGALFDQNTQGMLYSAPGLNNLALGAAPNVKNDRPAMVNMDGGVVYPDNRNTVLPGTSGGNTKPGLPPLPENTEPEVDTGGDVTGDGYTNSDPSQDSYVQEAQQILDSLSKPTYSPQWQGQMDTLMGQIMNRDPFSYDANEDPLYQMYRDMFAQNGQLAMMDTMGQAAAMTGGFGNSYAQSVGQQAYNQYMQQLNDVLPELQQMAFDKYAYEGDQMRANYDMLMDRENMDYGVYRDKVGDYQWQQEFDRTGQNTNYNHLVDLITTTGYVPSDAELAAAGMTKEQAAGYKNYYDGAKVTGNVDREDDAYWNKEIQRAIDANTIDALKVRMRAAGYSDEYINALISAYSGGNGGDDIIAGIPSDIQEKAAGYTNNDELAAYLDGEVAAGRITTDQADALFEKYVKDDSVGNNPGGTWSEMVQSTKGWSVVDDKKVNWFGGIESRSIVMAPNGEQIRLDNLVDKLVAEGMNKSAAKDLVKALQQNLGID